MSEVGGFPVSGAASPGAGYALSGGVEGQVGAPLLPSPNEYSEDCMTALFQIFADANRQGSELAKNKAETTFDRIAEQRAEQKAALEAALKAQEGGGIFDSIGLGGLVGLVSANPILVVADMAMHMSRLTPKFLKDFENDNKGTIALAAKMYCAVGTMGAVSSAALAVGGLVIQETAILGKDVSDWVGTGMLVVGGGCGAAVVCSDKDSAVADTVRDVEKETQEYNQWIAVAGMAVAGAAAIVGSFGSATGLVVAVGIALSLGGFAVAKTECFGEEASRWIGLGMTVAGGVVSGVGAIGMAGQATSTALAEAARVAGSVGNALDGAAKVRQGLETLESAAIQRDVERANIEAKEHLFATQRLQRMVEDIIDSVRDLKDSYRRVSGIVNETVETQSNAQLIAAGCRI